MKRKVIIIFFLLAPIVDLFYSCCPCDIETKYISYSHKSLLLKNLDNSGEKAIETGNLQLNKNAYGIRLYLTREKNTVACIKRINSIFIQSAYATSCECRPEYIYNASDSITSIRVFTLYKFDYQHPENSDITNYFKVRQTYSDVDEYIESIYYTNEKDWRWFEPIETELEIDLLLMTAPTTDNNHKFKIQIELSDGRILEQETTEIQLL